MSDNNAPSSSPAPAAPSSPAAPAPAPAATSASRPEGIPDQFWDTEKNALKVDDLTRVVKEHGDFTAARKAIPAKAEEYKAELPADLKLPDGFKFELKADDPVLLQARGLAHQLGVPQEGFSKLLGLYAGIRASEEAELRTFQAKGLEKLGPNSAARVDGAIAFLKTFGDDVAAPFAGAQFVPGQVEAIEKIKQAFTSQGVTPFTSQHRTQETPATAPIEQRWYTPQTKAS